MAVSVYIPTPFRRATGGQPRIDLDAADVKALLDTLERDRKSTRLNSSHRL